MQVLDVSNDSFNLFTECDLYIAAASFEYERSIAASTMLSKRLRAKCAIILAFTGKTSAAAQENKYQSRTRLFEQMSLIDISKAPRVVLAGQYEYSSTLRQIEGELEARGVSKCSAVILDISCLTAVQLVYVIRWLHSVVRPKSCVVIYSRPSRYDNENLTPVDYEIMPLPIRVSPQSTISEARRIAVMVMGHEGIRSLATWRAIDPVNTLLLFPASGSAKFDKTCSKQNSYLIGLSRKSPGVSVKTATTLDLARARKMVSSSLDDWSSASHVRVSLIPFGPKPLIVAATLSILDAANVDFELVYAIPKRYSGRYSAGVEAVYFEQIAISDDFRKDQP